MKWWIEKIAPAGQVHIFAGVSGAGKTSYVLEYFIPSLLRGEWEGFASHTRSVHYVMTDRDRTDWEIMCSRWPHLRSFPVTIASELGRYPTLPIITGRIARSGPVDLVVVDVLPMLYQIDLNSYTQSFRMMADAQQMAKELGCTVLAIMHARKHQGPARESPDPFDRVLGSMALRGAAGTVWVLEKVRLADESYVRLHVRPHHYEELSFYYRRGAEGYIRTSGIPYNEIWWRWLNSLPDGYEFDLEDIEIFTPRKRKRYARKAVRLGLLVDLGDGCYRVCRSLSSGSSGGSSGPSTASSLPMSVSDGAVRSGDGECSDAGKTGRESSISPES